MKVSVRQVHDALGDLRFPATKDEIVGHVEQRRANEVVVKAMRSLPLAQYDSVDQVARSVETVDEEAASGR